MPAALWKVSRGVAPLDGCRSLQVASLCSGLQRLASRPGAVVSSAALLVLQRPDPAVTSRKQLSMVMPEELIAAIKQRASAQGLSVTAYVVELVHRDLGEPSQLNARQLAAQLQRLQERVDVLERRGQDRP